MPEAGFSSWFFANLAHITTWTGIIAFFVSFVVKRRCHHVLMDAMTRAATWCALPNGIGFLICTSDPSFIPKIADSSVAFFMGGLALIAVGLWDLKLLFTRETKHDRVRAGWF